MSEEKSFNFIEQIISEDLKSGKHQEIHTRFPPEPNGYLHIGHASSICLNFGIAKDFNGTTNLRFDDTNPAKEDEEFVESIKADIKWLGFDWEDRLFFTSDYFDLLYDFAIRLVKDGLAYIDEQTSEEMAEQKGTPTEPGKNSPFRERPIEENLDLLERMKNGEFEERAMVLRAKIDMANPNMHLRDPLMYRIINAAHHRTGNKWHIYPMYDFAHGQSDSIENITHSLCSLEFEVHRPLYEWYLKHFYNYYHESNGVGWSRQIEFARRNLSYTVMSKRKLAKLVEDGIVDGWDDPRMPTISGLRRRGYTPESIVSFSDRIGVSKRNNVTDVSLLEFSVKDHLNKIAPRVMVVLRPLKVVITNYPENKTEMLTTVNNPEDPSQGHRDIPFGKELWIEEKDFNLNPSKQYNRLSPNQAVRLKSAYIIEVEKHVTDDQGKVVEVHCKYYPNSKSGEDTSGVKVRGTIHWVAAKDAIDAEVRLYDRLFSDPFPDSHKDKDFMEFLNKNSLEILKNCKLEPSLSNAQVGEHFQFQRNGYFCVDSKNSTPNHLVFNRTVTLSDSWAKKKETPHKQKVEIDKEVVGDKIIVKAIKLVQLSKKQYKKANVGEGNEPLVMPAHLKEEIADLAVGKTFKMNDFSLEVSALKDENILSLPGKILQQLGIVADKTYRLEITGDSLELVQ